MASGRGRLVKGPSMPVAAVVFAVLAAACGGSSPRVSPRPGTPTPTAAPDAGGRAVRATVPTTTVTGHDAITLVGGTGVTPAELDRAERLIGSTITALQRFTSPAQAYAAGYRSIGDTKSRDEHYVNWSYVNDGHILDPARPESVVYEHRDGRQVAVAAMYSLPIGSTFADVPDVGGALTQWHVHRNLCLTDDPRQKIILRFTAVDGSCPAGTSKASNTPMLHVWIVPNRCGPFASLEFGGQFPEGEVRQCDTRNAAVP